MNFSDFDEGAEGFDGDGYMDVQAGGENGDDEEVGAWAADQAENVVYGGE